MAQSFTQPQRKLRASCDSCTGSKVRCDKEQPSCRRCITAGMTCVYGVSRKHGRQVHRRRVDERSNPIRSGSFAGSGHLDTGIAGGRSYMDSDLCIDDFAQDLDFLDPRSIEQSEGQDLYSFLTPVSQRSRVDVSYMPLGRSSASMSNLSPTSTNLLTSNAYDGRENRSSQSFYQQNDILFSPLGTPSTTPTLPSGRISFQHPRSRSSGSIPRPVKDAQTHRTHPCYALATSTLEGLHLENRFSCASKSKSKSTEPEISTPVLTLDQILRTNKIAMSKVQQLLDCSCSAADPHLAFLYASIICKIISWYGDGNRIISNAVAESASRGPSTARSRPPASRLSTTAFEKSMADGLSGDDYDNEGDFAEASTNATNMMRLKQSISSSTADFLPMTVGIFELDAEDRAALSRQLLLSELRKVGRVVEQVQKRRRDGGAGPRECTTAGANGPAWDSNNAGNGTGPLGELYGILSAWLHRELKRTVQSMQV